ncbi:MAG: hypothetical protein DI536_36910, partial [Archangium gephyra]
MPPTRRHDPVPVMSDSTQSDAEDSSHQKPYRIAPPTFRGTSKESVAKFFTLLDDIFEECNITDDKARLRAARRAMREDAYDWFMGTVDIPSFEEFEEQLTAAFPEPPRALELVWSINTVPQGDTPLHTFLRNYQLNVSALPYKLPSAHLILSLRVSLHPYFAENFDWPAHTDPIPLADLLNKLRNRFPPGSTAPRDPAVPAPRFNRPPRHLPPRPSHPSASRPYPRRGYDNRPSLPRAGALAAPGDEPHVNAQQCRANKEVWMLVAGRWTRAALDTGSDINIITSPVAEQLGLRLSPAHLAATHVLSRPISFDAVARAVPVQAGTRWQGRLDFWVAPAAAAPVLL